MIRKKRLLLIATTAQTFEQILKGQPKHLSEKFDVRLIFSGREQLAVISNFEGCKCTHVKMKRGISPFTDILSLCKLIFFILRFKPDLIHSYTPKAGLLAAIAGFICRTRVRIHTFTGLLFPTEVGLKKAVLKISDFVVCFLNTDIVAEGHGVKEDLEVITSRRLEVIGNGNIAGVDCEYFSPAFESNERSYAFNSGFTFCYVGRLNKDKGIAELISAFEKLPSSANCNLLIVGGLDKENPIAIETLKTIECSNKISWVGQVEDIRPYLSAANVHVLPSYREGFPNVVLQASAMAKPSIVTDVNGSREIVVDGVSGWIVPSKSVTELLAAMIESYGHQFLDTMGTEARNRVVEKFERSNYLEQLGKYYDSRFNKKTV